MIKVWGIKDKRMYLVDYIKGSEIKLYGDIFLRLKSDFITVRIGDVISDGEGHISTITGYNSVDDEIIHEYSGLVDSWPLEFALRHAVLVSFGNGIELEK